MKLAPQETEIPLNTGQNSNASVELQAADTLAAVTNLRWNRLGEIEKRPRYASSALATVPAGGRYANVSAEAVFAREREVFALTDNYGIASANPGDFGATLINNAAAWMPRACLVSRRTIERAQYNSEQFEIRHATAAAYGETTVLAYISGPKDWGTAPVDARLYFKAFNSETGQLLAPVKEILLNPYQGTHNLVQCVPYTGPGAPGVLITYTSGTAAPYTIFTYLYDAAARTFTAGPSIAPSAVKYLSHAIQKERVPFGDPDEFKYYLSYVDYLGGTVVGQHGTLSQMAAGTAPLHNSSVTDARSTCIVQGATITLIGYTTGANLARCESFGNPLSVSTLIPPITDETLYGITGAQENDSDEAVFWIEAAGSDTGRAGGLFAKVRSSHVDFTPTFPIPNVRSRETIPFTQLAGGGFSLDGRAYVAVRLRKRLALEVTSVVLARFHNLNHAAHKHDLVARLCHDRYVRREGALTAHGEPMVDVSNTVNGNEVRYAFMGDPLSMQTGAQSVFLSTVTFAPRRLTASGLFARSSLPLPSVEHNGITYMASGNLAQYDAEQLVEAAAISAPVLQVDFSTTGTTTYSAPVSIVAIYRYVDAQGNLHESSPSNVITVPAVNLKNVRATISFPAFTAYDYDTNITALEAELYATEQGGSTFYLLHGPTGLEKLILNGPDAHLVWWTIDNIPFGTPDHRQLRALGASGGEIPPEPPPAFRSIAVVGDRMWGVDAEDTSRIWFTKPFAAGYAPEWSTFCTLVVGDDCVAVADVAGVPTVLGAAGSYQIYGTGPDSLGNGTFEPARRLHEIGCIDPLVCNTPLGLFFRGRRGYYALAGQLSPIGLPIDPMTNSIGPVYRRTRAPVVFDEPHNEIRVINGNGGRYFVFNLLEQKWSEWTQAAAAQDCVDAVICDGFVHHLQWDGQACAVRREAGDNISTEGWGVTTAWLKLDGVGGAVRLWRVWACLASGFDIANVQTLRLVYQLDYRIANVQAWTWTGAELAALAASPTGLQLAVQPAIQVARAIRFLLSVTMAADTAGPKPLVLRLAFGVRPGQGKRTRPDVK